MTKMVEDHRSSLAFRKSREEIFARNIPQKYVRLLPFIKGKRILEFGAAEGVLSLLLAQQKGVDKVVALELRGERHNDAVELQKEWAKHVDVSVCEMHLGDIRDNTHLFLGVDTVVAIRAIYYLREDALRVMHTAYESGVERVVLCGNKGRQANHRANPKTESGRFDYYAATEGMKWVLESVGFKIEAIVDGGDPVVVGVR